MSGLRFDVIAELSVSVPGQDELFEIGQGNLFDTDPVNGARVAYIDANRRFAAAGTLPGFQGYSMRPGKDVIINGEHVALCPRIFKDGAA